MIKKGSVSLMNVTNKTNYNIQVIDKEDIMNMFNKEQRRTRGRFSIFK